MCMIELQILYCVLMDEAFQGDLSRQKYRFLFSIRCQLMYCPFCLHILVASKIFSILSVLWRSWEAWNFVLFEYLFFFNWEKGRLFLSLMHLFANIISSKTSTSNSLGILNSHVLLREPFSHEVSESVPSCRIYGTIEFSTPNYKVISL